jgi:hypothetical protein
MTGLGMIAVTEATRLVAASRGSLVGSYSKLAQHCRAGEVREFGTAIAFATGVPIALFNGCLAIGAGATDVGRAVDWITGRALPFQLWVDGGDARPDLGELALGRGLRQESWSPPGMVLSPMPGPPTPPRGVRIEQIELASFEPWLTIVAGNGMPLELAELLFSPSFAADPDVALFAGYLDGVPAATWAAVNAGREWGCSVATLQPTEMAFSGYAKMGFEQVELYATYTSPE